MKIKRFARIALFSVLSLIAIVICDNASAQNQRKRSDLIENRMARKEVERHRKENARDRREHMRDRRENLRDRKENIRDRREARRDRKH